MVLFRSALAALVIVCVLQAAAHWEDQARGRVAAYLLAAILVGGILLSWRASYRSLAAHVSAGVTLLRLQFKTSKLIFDAERIRRWELLSLVEKLEQQREYLKPLLGSPQFGALAGSMLVLFFRGEESPLAAQVFSNSLRAIGLRINVREYLADERQFVGELGKHAGELDRMVLIVGQGSREADVEWWVPFLESRGIRVAVIPFALVSRSGLTLFPEEHFHLLPTDVYLTLKEYLESAASLAKGRSDGQLNRQPTQSPVYR